ncbi:hypothetical protein ALC57_06321 [Trachymyrmex cornetzi]|uniref:Uncharacterized protein n=1 Tax=Trachymyrmex cornetzi TaxID=471704 RepID=A0A195E857_9HYME|nr:hypothetical protein ALC57_06321 [Trachymyrmex cornetzi]
MSPGGDERTDLRQVGESTASLFCSGPTTAHEPPGPTWGWIVLAASLVLLDDVSAYFKRIGARKGYQGYHSYQVDRSGRLAVFDADRTHAVLRPEAPSPGTLIPVDLFCSRRVQRQVCTENTGQCLPLGEYQAEKLSRVSLDIRLGNEQDCARGIVCATVEHSKKFPVTVISNPETRSRRVVRPSFAATEAVAATQPLASGIKWDFTGAWTATALRRIPRWRKRQLRNAKPPPCCCTSARFTSELRVASEPCESRESTSWRSSIGNWENIVIGEANDLRNETLHVCRQLNTERSVKDDNEWVPVKDRLIQEQSSLRGIARNRKWRRKADKGRGNRKPSLPSESETIRGYRSKIVCQMREEQTGVTRRNHRCASGCGCVSEPGAQGDPQANYPTIMLALNVQDRAIRVTLFIPRFRT